MRRSNLAGAVVIAIGLVAAAIAFAVVTTLLDSADATTDLRLARIEETLAASERERAELAEGLALAQVEIARLREDLSLVANRAAPPEQTAEPRLATAASEVEAPAAREEDGQIIDLNAGAGENFTVPPETEEPREKMNIGRSHFNTEITQPRNEVMLELLGRPRVDLSNDCQQVTNERLASLLETRQIGPIRVTMLRPALDSLERIMKRLEENEPDIYAKLGTAGALCARLIRGSASSISNHSWGTAIDLSLEGELDAFADGGTQLGLVILAEYFNDEGWFWGATYGREDSMHFEVGEESLRAWAAEGRL